MSRTLAPHVAELVGRLTDRLSQQGYAVSQNEEEASRTGKSGAVHVFDVLGTREDGCATYTVAVGVAAAEEGELGLSAVFSFDDMCYDCGIRHKVFLAFPRVEDVAERFAQNQRIHVLNEDDIEALLANPVSSIPPEGTSVTEWDNRTRVLSSLATLGYSIIRNARVTGRSGAEYVFDAIATYDDGIIINKIAIDEIHEDNVTLSRISVFDAKSFDAGILQKVVLVSGPLTPEAQQFANLQQIRIMAVSVTSENGDQPDVEAPLDGGLQIAVEQLLDQKVTHERTIKTRPQPEALDLIPESMARKFEVVPLAIVNGSLQVAMANPSDIFALEALGLQCRMRIEPIASTQREVRDAIDMNYRGFGQIEEQISRIEGVSQDLDEQSLIEAAKDTPVASALRLIIDEAAKARASDIHLEPQEDKLQVRYRVDGALHEVMSLPVKIHLP